MDARHGVIKDLCFCRSHPWNSPFDFTAQIDTPVPIEVALLS
jgi:hypothetical protein